MKKNTPHPEISLILASNDHTKSKMEEECNGSIGKIAYTSKYEEISKYLSRKSKVDLIKAYQELALQFKENEKRFAELYVSSQELVIKIKEKGTKFDQLAESHKLLSSSDAVTFSKRKRAEKKLLQLNNELEQKLAESTRKSTASEVRFRSLIENSVEGITLTDKFFNVLYRSNGAQKILHIPPFGNKINFIHPDECKALKNIYAKVLKNPNIPIPFLGRFLHESGNYIWLEGTYTNLLHLEEVNAIVSNYRDVTKRKNLEILLHKANSLARIGSWEVDLLRETIYWDDITREIHEAENSFVPDLAAGINFYKDGPGRELITEKVKMAINLGESWDLELEIVTAKNNDRWIRTIGEPEVVNEKCVKIFGSFQDISQQKLVEKKIRKANRLYLFISQISQMIVRLPDESTLFAETCRIAVELGKFKMAWIGMIDETTKKVIPVNVAGVDRGYLSYLTEITSDDVAEGRGPTGTALREGKYIVSNDIENDPRMLPWKNAALERGYFSSISLPIKKFGKVVGTLNFYASEKNFFDSEEIRMLEEATGDVAFALEIFDKEKYRRQTEKDLEKANERLLIAQEISLLGYWELDLIGSKHFCSRIMFKIFNTPKKDSINGVENFMTLVHPEDRQKYFESHTAMIEKNIPQNLEYRIIQQDGSIRHLITKAKVVVDVNGLAIRVEGTTQDITERKKAELNLLSSQARTKKLFDSDMIGFIFWDAEGEILDANDRFLKMTGYSRKDLEERKINWFKMTPPEYAELDILALDQITQTGICQPFEKEYIRKDGRNLHVLLGATGFEGLNSEKGVAYVMDISERKINEREIENYKYALNQSSIVAITDQKGIINQVNKNFCKISKYTAEELIGQDHRIINSGYHPQSFIRNLWKTIAQGKIWRGEMCNKAKDNTIYWVDTTIVPLLDDHGKPIKYIAIRSDITDRKQIEEANKRTTEQIHILSTHIQTIREEERKRIAREIHDHMGQQLTAIKMDTVWIDKQISADKVVLKGKLRNIIELLDESHQSVHKILNELRPTELNNNGLMEVLQWLGKQFTESTGTPVQFDCNLSSYRLPQETSSCIFRVYQESLTNIIRYAQADKVLSSLKVIKGRIVLTIEDNGKGFNVELSQNKKSFGLLGMKERVHSLNGKIDFASLPGEGTKIVISLPYKKTLE